ncbi:MAG: hypothetical protein IKG39_12875 [Lachnospiraceae bacterium]|nr:hypothetical protein [Lachnospiraceae bacterium]
MANEERRVWGIFIHKMMLTKAVLDWFKYQKPYSGRFGTDPMRGCLSCTTFNFRVQSVKEETDQIIKAVCFLEPPVEFFYRKGGKNRSV